MNNKMNFIKTNDSGTAEQLRKLMFTELQKEGNFFVFLNDKNMSFSNKEDMKITYSNIINC